MFSHCQQKCEWFALWGTDYLRVQRYIKKHNHTQNKKYLTRWCIFQKCLYFGYFKTLHWLDFALGGTVNRSDLFPLNKFVSMKMTPLVWALICTWSHASKRSNQNEFWWKYLIGKSEYVVCFKIFHINLSLGYNCT